MTSIIHFADVHFGVEDQDALSMIEGVVADLKPDVCLIAGDITQTGSIEEFEAAHNWIKSLPGKIVASPGNHDTPLFGMVHRVFSPFKRYRKHIEPVTEPFYADKNVIIHTINTSRGWQMKLDWSLGVVDMNELDSKIRDLHAAEPGALKMLMCHHPFIYPEESTLDGETENGPEALRALSKANIDAVLSGHVHIPFVKHRWPDETRMLSIGAGTLSTRSRGRAASFNHIQIDEKDVKVTLVEWIGGQFIHSELHGASRESLAPLS